MKKIKVKIVSDENIELIKEAIINQKILFDDNANTFFIEAKDNANNIINIKLINGEALIRIDQIYSLESFDHEINICCDEIYKTRTPLKDLLPLLNEDFIQINQSTIINYKKIEKVFARFNQTYELHLINNTKFIVTRTYFKSFNKKMGI